MAKYLIGIDAGSTSSKAVIFDETGKVVASASTKSSERMHLAPRGRGFEEFDVDELWRIVSQCIKQAIEKAGIAAEDIAGIGITSFGNGIVFLDKNGWSIAPGCFSQDYRANDIIALYQQEGTYEKINRMVHGTLFAGEPGPILRWYKEHERAVYDRIGSVLMFKDYLMYRLSGKFATDLNIIGGSFMVDMDTMEYSEELMNRYGIPEMFDKLPTLYSSPEQIVGTVTKEAAEMTGLCEGTPIAAGMMDILASLVGAGATGDGVITSIAGSWCINETHSDRVIPNASSNMPYIHKNEYLNCSYTGASATNYEWFHHVLGDKARLTAVYEQRDYYDVLNEWIRQAEPNMDTPYFQPFVASPSIHVNARAGFSNINMHTSYGELCYAVVEGIAFIHKFHIDFLINAGLPASLIRLTGGMAKSPVWTQIFADTMRLPVEIVECDETGAHGVAIVAGIGAGVYKNYEEAFARSVKLKPPVVPNPEKATFYQKRYAEWQRLNRHLLQYWSENQDG